MVGNYAPGLHNISKNTPVLYIKLIFYKQFYKLLKYQLQ